MSEGLLLDLGDHSSPPANPEANKQALAFIENEIAAASQDTESKPSEIETQSEGGNGTHEPVNGMLSSPKEPNVTLTTQMEPNGALISPVEPNDTPEADVRPISFVKPNGTVIGAPEASAPSTEAEDTTQVPTTDEHKKVNEPTTAVDDPRLHEIMEKFGGRWKMVRSDPYDEYLKSLGVGFFNRKLAGRAFHDMDVTVKGDTILVAMRSLFHNQHYRFKLDEEVENLVEKVKQGVVCTFEDGKLIQQMTPLDSGSKMQQVERSINEDDEHVVIFTAGEAICRRYYARLPVLSSTQLKHKDYEQIADQKDDSTNEKIETSESKNTLEKGDNEPETSEYSSRPTEKSEETIPRKESSSSA